MEENAQNVNPTPPVSPAAETLPVSHPEYPPDRKKGSKFSLVAIITIILFLLIAGSAAGFYAFKPQIMKLISKPNPTPTLVVRTTPFPTPTASNSADATANGKTYTNPKYGYSINIFPGFVHSLDQNIGGTVVSGDRDNFYKGTTEGAGFHGEALVINIYPQKGNESNLDLGATQVGPRAVASTYKIDGNTVKKVVDPGFGLVYIGPLIKNGNVYNFEIYGGQSDTTYKDVYDMLSTFTFAPLSASKSTDANSTPTCMPRPACLDSNPRCMIAEPMNGWCP